ncbi:MAG: N-acetylglucosamine-6-phosphate deacetylase [Opitutales bacterium]|nr:N-acetylglucosamine-6-phosphate deacetylase [Opitutales bacterium]
MKGALLIKNAKIPRGESFERADILCEGGIIAEVSPEIKNAGCPEFDAGLRAVVPGFIDIHFHGRGGFDFCDASVDALEAISRGKLAEGVTGMVPATLTLDYPDLKKAFLCAREFSERGGGGARLLGIHLEGPFINPEMAGAQNAKFARACDISLVDSLDKIFKVLKVSYSIELDENLDFLRALSARKIAASCAHSNAGFAAFEKAFRGGLRNITHFGNRVSPVASRDIGIAGAGLLFDDVYTEIIADKFHLSRDMLRLVFAKRPASKIVLISDAMRASGMPGGVYSLGGLEVFAGGGCARLKDGSLAGSVLKINEALKNVSEICGVKGERLFNCASLNPAQSLGIGGFGKIEKGYAADFAVIDENFGVEASIVGGDVKYRA